MVSSKSILLVSLLLAGCAVKFDPVEHSKLIDIRHRVDVATRDHHCRQSDLAKATAEQVHRDSIWLLMYSQHIPNNSSLEKMSTELVKTAEEFAGRYRGSPPSTVYCELKLKNIAQQVEIIQRTNARRPR